MNSPDNTKKLQLKGVSIVGLFGRYNHEFVLAESDGVTILHGPNGVGKTAILRLLFAVFAGRSFQVFATRFSQLDLIFEGKERIRIERSKHSVDPFDERIVVYAVDALGLETKVEASTNSKTLTKFASSIARRIPWLDRIEDDLWVDRPTGELLLKFDGPDQDFQQANLSAGEQIKPLLTIYSVLQELGKRVDVHIIETQRLLTKVKRSERRPYSSSNEADAEVRTSVEECAEELKQRIGVSLSRYATESQRLDESFPFRLLALAKHSQVDPQMLRNQLKEIGDKRIQLSKVGLLVEKNEPYARTLESLDLDAADDAQRRVIELYAGDTSGKLATLDEVLQVASLFFGVVNARFKHKQLVLDREKGLVANNESLDAIRLDGLSSGEQHQLVLFFDLIFRVQEGSLVLMDEPELSLHVSWQKSMLDSLIEIARVKSLDILIATHSPYIVGSRIDLMRELSSPGYSDDDAFI
jgi:predicted ATP-binding protein involved in virulence